MNILLGLREQRTHPEKNTIKSCSPLVFFLIACYKTMGHFIFKKRKTEMKSRRSNEN